MGKILWTPEILLAGRGYNFAAFLDRDFAIRMLNSKTAPEERFNLNQIANEELKKHRIATSDPFEFYNNSLLVNQFNIGQGGRWLATVTLEWINETSTEPVKYSSHNIDSSADAYALLGLFGKWIEYVELFRND